LYSLLIKGGLVIDPAQDFHGKRDIAISSGRVAAVERKIPESKAKKIIDATGMVVTPGLIDIHTHTAHNVVRLCVDPIRNCLLRGTTTVVDAGSTGELNFAAFKKFVIEKSKARILALLNIESLGMIEFADVRPRWTDQEWPKLLTAVEEAFAKMFINVENTINTIRRNRSTIVGIKWAHHGIMGMALAREAADKARCRLMIENHFMPQAMKFVKRGDIVTHLYHNYFNPHAGYYDGLTDDGKIRPEFYQALKRGVILDVGHGKGSFSWKVAELAFREGIKPHTVSSDLWIGNVNGPVFDLPTTMSKFLHLGMELDEVVRTTTATPASVIGRAGELGTLKRGVCADVVIFKIKEGRFPFVDSYGKGRTGSKLLVPIKVLRGGSLVP
jgi:dihydroorotase